jgi:hypothetical protein
MISRPASERSRMVWSRNFARGPDAHTPSTAVMNYTEMEAKVREATNNEPWGASST